MDYPVAIMAQPETGAVPKDAPYGVIDGTVGSALVLQSDSNQDVERAFVAVTLPSIDEKTIIDLAVLVVTVSTQCDSTDPLFLMACEATVAPASQPMTWQKNWTDLSGGFDPEHIALVPVSSSAAEVEIRFDVTAIVRRWAAGEAPNYGFVLKSLSEYKSSFHWIRDGRYDGQDAKLEICYSRNPLSQ